LPGKYWLQQQASPDLAAKWQYYVSDGVDGKRTGWYPYDDTASDEVEELYAQHMANTCESRTATRMVSSGRFTYKVCLTKMMQMNTRTQKVRQIRRAVGDEATEVSANGVTKERAVKAKRVVMAMKSKVRTMKAKKVVMVMKSMKAMKIKRKCTVGSKSQVLSGKRPKTKWGLKASDLVKNKAGKVVSKKKSALGKKQYEKHLAKWASAFTKARHELGLTGFVAIKKGTAFYNKVKELSSQC